MPPALGAEAVLNDAVAVVLFSTMSQLDPARPVDGPMVGLVLGQFALVTVASVGIGAGVALLAALGLKKMGLTASPAEVARSFHPENYSIVIMLLGETIINFPSQQHTPFDFSPLFSNELSVKTRPLNSQRACF